MSLSRRTFTKESNEGTVRLFEWGATTILAFGWVPAWDGRIRESTYFTSFPSPPSLAQNFRIRMRIRH
jgi:hypothetical protein